MRPKLVQLHSPSLSTEIPIIKINTIKSKQTQDKIKECGKEGNKNNTKLNKSLLQEIHV